MVGLAYERGGDGQRYLAHRTPTNSHLRPTELRRLIGRTEFLSLAFGLRLTGLASCAY